VLFDEFILTEFQEPTRAFLKWGYQTKRRAATPCGEAALKEQVLADLIGGGMTLLYPIPVE
jgi:hypothetical protein